MNPSSVQNLSRPVREFAKPVETVLHAHQTIQQALDCLRTRKIEQKVTYFYVTDETGRLMGVIPTRKLLLGDPSELVRKVMDPYVISIPDTMTLEEAMEMFAMHRLLAFPVVDAHGKLVGHIDIDLYAEEAVDVSESQRAAELFQLIGLSVEQLRRPTAWSSYLVRMPWLMCNVIGGIVCAIIAAGFEHLLKQALVVAMFIPLVLTLSEAISMQSMTITLQQLRLTTAAWRSLWRRSSSEWKVMVMIGLSCGAIAGLAATSWAGGLPAAGAIAMSICISMVVAATLGAAVPILLHMFRLDPKVAAGPVVLMVGDILTTVLYLSLAAWWLA
jgi:magnesium transporter